MTLRVEVLLAGWALILGCGRSAPDSDPARNPAPASEAAAHAANGPAGIGIATAGPIVPVSTGSSTPQGRSACPRTGLWANCSVERRLTQAGFVVRRSSGSPHRAGFSVTPQLYTLGKSRLEVFLYPTEKAANADVGKLDTASASPRGVANPWGMPPTFVRSANLLAVFLTDNPTYAERLTLALTAGAPQP